MAVQEQAMPGGATIRRREAGFWSEALRHLVRNKAAVVGGIIMFAFNFLGDGLRDALDPRLRGTQ